MRVKTTENKIAIYFVVTSCDYCAILPLTVKTESISGMTCMRRDSHRQLGQFLADKCLEGRSRLCVSAFKFGCIEPDINPATYIKGSRKIQRLRGHNFRNAESYMRRSAEKLEEKGVRGVLSHYRMGKLVHYITDGFTFAHNDDFPGTLKEHSRYEHGLNSYFLEYLRTREHDQRPDMFPLPAFSLIQRRHREYSLRPSDMAKDAEYAVSTALQVVADLIQGRGRGRAHA